jgi:hypothetical protein
MGGGMSEGSTMGDMCDDHSVYVCEGYVVEGGSCCPT